MDSKEYLKLLQTAYGKEPILEEDFDAYSEWLQSEEVPDSDIRIIINKAKASRPKEQPSKFQNPITYSIISDILNEIKRATIFLPKSLYHINTNPSLPVFGTIDISAFIAELKMPNNEPIIIISEYVFSFAKQLSKIVSLMFKQIASDEKGKTTYSIKRNDIAEQINKDNHIVAAYCDLVLATILKEDLHKCVYENDNALSLGFEYAFDHFVVAHEFAHYLLKHPSTESTIRMAQYDVTSFVYEWSYEYEADEVGFILSMASMRDTFNRDGVHAMIGIIICFHSIELFAKINTIREEKDYYSHPTARLRLNKLIDEFFSSEEMKGAISIFRDIMDVLDYLWNNFEEKYKQYKEALTTLNWSESEKDYSELQTLMLYLNDCM